MRTSRAWGLAAIIYSLLHIASVVAAPGDVDTTYNAETGVSGWVNAVIPLTQGKVLIAGEFSIVQGARRDGIARLNADGSLDSSFVPPLFPNVAVFSAVVQADARIVVGGSRNGGWISRLNPDGSLDKSFSPPSLFGQQISKVIVQPDSRIIVGGMFQKNGGAPGDLVTRLNSDGSVDKSFNLTAFAERHESPAISLQDDGKFIVTAGGAPIRFNADGSVDPSFAVAGFYSMVPEQIALQPDGKLLVGGFIRIFPYSQSLNVIRLNSDGSLDGSFFPLRRSDYYHVAAIELEHDGSIVVAGSSSTNCEVLRLNTNGEVDRNFASPRGAATDLRALALDTSDKIYVGGGFCWPHGVANLARLRNDGTLDLSFAPGFSLAAVFVPKIVTDTGNKVIASLAGYRNQMAVQRFNWDGSADTNFAMAPLRGQPTVLTLQKDRKFLICSACPAEQSIVSEFKRLNSDGTEDSSFKFSGATKPIHAAIQQPDGKILIGGEFTTLYGLAADRVARLNADGTIDHSFQSLAFFGSPAVEDDFVRTLALQPDGKILVGLGLNSCGCTGVKPTAVLRLNADGSYDYGFDASGMVPNFVDSLLMQPDGKILVGGFQFSPATTNALPKHGLIRLNEDGSLDAKFNTTLEIGADVRGMFFDANGRIVINSVFSVMRLDPGGALDNTFNVARADDGGQYTTALALARDGNIYFADSFTTVNQVRRPGLVRLFGSPVPIPVSVSATGGTLTLNWSNQAMRLQSATSVDGPYSDVSNATSPWRPVSSGERLFFRLRGE